MKGILKCFLFLIVVVGAWIAYENLKSDETAESADESVAPSTQTGREQPATMRSRTPQSRSPSSRRSSSRGRRGAQPPTVSKRSQINVAASKAGCKVVSYSESGRSAVVTVESRDRNSLGNFLDQCIRQTGMTDVETVKQLSARQERGVRIFSSTFKISW